MGSSVGLSITANLNLAPDHILSPTRAVSSATNFDTPSQNSHLYSIGTIPSHSLSGGQAFRGICRPSNRQQKYSDLHPIVSRIGGGLSLGV